jgi:hypothetical protein
VAEFLIKLGAPAVLILLSKFIDIFFLPAPGTWEPGLGEGVRYAAALAGATVAHRIADSKAIAILAPLVSMVCCAFGYQYLIQHPPTAAGIVWRTILMPVTFLLTYFLLGFLVSVAVATIWPHRKKP